MTTTSVDIPDLSGKVCLVTGANVGLGEAVVTALAQHNPRKIYLCSRSQDKAEAAVERIRATSKVASAANIDILILDLASFDSVKAAAQRVNDEVDRLDILHLNGGVASIPHSTTTNGYEVQFGVNYLGHVLLTQLLMPKLLATKELPGADVRVVVMSSKAQKIFAPDGGVLFDELTTDMSARTGMELYGQSNVARTLFAFEMAKKYPNITTTSVHPGTVKSSIWGREVVGMNPIFRYVVIPAALYFTGVSTETGALNQLWCSVSKDIVNGAYYEPVGVRGGGKYARDDALSARLWEWTEKELAKNRGPGWAKL